MIREGHKLPPDVESKIPQLLDRIAEEQDIIALYAFGSLASGELKPLSDLDFGILVSGKLDKKKRFDRHLDLIGEFNEVLKTEEMYRIIQDDLDDFKLFEQSVVKFLNAGEKNRGK